MIGMILALLWNERWEHAIGHVILDVQEGKHFVAFRLMLAAQGFQNWGDVPGESIPPALQMGLRKDLIARMILALQQGKNSVAFRVLFAAQGVQDFGDV